MEPVKDRLEARLEHYLQDKDKANYKREYERALQFGSGRSAVAYSRRTAGTLAGNNRGTRKASAAHRETKTGSYCRTGVPQKHVRLRTAHESLIQLLQEAERPDLTEEAIDQAILDFRKVAELTDTAPPHENLARLCEKFDRLDVAIESMRLVCRLQNKYNGHKNRLIGLYEQRCVQHDVSRRHDLLNATVDATLKDLREFSDQTLDSKVFHKRLAHFAEKYRRFGDAIIGYQRAAKVENRSTSISK